VTVHEAMRRELDSVEVERLFVFRNGESVEQSLTCQDDGTKNAGSTGHCFLQPPLKTQNSLKLKA